MKRAPTVTDPALATNAVVPSLDRRQLLRVGSYPIDGACPLWDRRAMRLTRYGTGPILAILVLLSACRDTGPIPRSLGARLQSLADSEKKELSPDEIQQALSRQLRVAPVPSQGGGTPATTASPVFPTRETLTGFYDTHQQQLIWCDESGKTLPRAHQLLDVLRRAGEHGLAPEDYAVVRLDALEAQLGKGGLDDAAVLRLADFDVLMTAAFFRYGADVSTGRFHPDEVEEDWHTNPPELDLVAALDDALARGDLTELLDGLPPPHPGYERLRQGLATLREMDAAGGWPTIPSGPKLGPGSHGPRVAMVRQRLSGAAAGGKPSDDAAGLTGTYDSVLASLVKNFQTLHGIEPDGIVSDRTLEELNVAAKYRIRQVELNLERWRWIPRKLGDPHVLVNIPGFDLELDRGELATWHTRVVTGKAFTPTPVFSDSIVAVVVHPPWNVPESIAVNELLPELRKNPHALAKKGLRLLQGEGDKAQELNPAKVDWTRVDADHFPYRFRQEPGEDNPLGQLKFDLTNGFHVYLHDTPASRVFGKSERDVSHGCIRVQNAIELADQIASEPVRAKIHEALDHPEERRIQLDAKIPVHILYWTAWADDAGNLHFGPDIYDFDHSQLAAIDKKPPIGT